MRKFFKIISRIFAVLIILLVVAWIIVLDPVDHSPYFKSDYYATTRTRLDSLISNASLSRGEVQIGFSKINITPVFNNPVTDAQKGWFVDVPLAGYGNREGAPAEGVHDSLYVKAMALQAGNERIIIVAADMLIVPPNVSEPVAEKLNKKTGIEREQIFYTATHTHSGVGAWSQNYVGEAFGGTYNPLVVEWLVNKFSDAIEGAVLDLKAGRIGSGRFNAPGLVRNRLVGDLGQENSECSIIVAEQSGGRRAILAVFDAHATTLSSKNMDFSADYPAYWYQKMESKGFDLAFFCAGAVGSHGPEISGKNFEAAKHVGQSLADSALKYIPSIGLRDTIELVSITTKIELPEFHVRISDDQRIAPFISKKLFPPLGEVFLQTARIGDLIWATIPADYSGESAIEMKNALYKKGYFSTFTSFNGGYTGYIIPEKYYHLNEYESRAMSWFGPNMEPYINEILWRMSEGITSNSYIIKDPGSN